MIYIIQKSKKTNRAKKITFDVDEAKKFLYRLTPKNFLVDRYVIVGAEPENELLNLFSFFNKDYFILSNENGFETYVVNENVIKNDRIKMLGINLDSIEKFCKKIEKVIPDSQVISTNFGETFDLYILSVMGDMKLVCNYNLEIKERYIMGTEGLVDVSSTDFIVKKVNEIFRKQRYYYRSKHYE